MLSRSTCSVFRRLPLGHASSRLHRELRVLSAPISHAYSNVFLSPFTSGSKGNTPKISQPLQPAERFESLAISASLKDTIGEVLQYDEMSRCQAMSIPVALTGVDVLTKVRTRCRISPTLCSPKKCQASSFPGMCFTQAKTGTGKTLAFLLPCLDQLIQRRHQNRGQGRQQTTSILIISPARELASQIGNRSVHFPSTFSSCNGHKYTTSS
jgi:superfamily II DNA/RNA helicase